MRQEGKLVAQNYPRLCVLSDVVIRMVTIRSLLVTCLMERSVIIGHLWCCEFLHVLLVNGAHLKLKSRIRPGTVVALWLTHRTADRKIGSSNPSAAKMLLVGP